MGMELEGQRIAHHQERHPEAQETLVYTKPRVTPSRMPVVV